MKKVLGCLSMAALAVVLAAPVSAQTLTLKASVPFDFVVGGRTMPAGDYEVGTLNEGGVLAVRNASSGALTKITSLPTALPGDPGKVSIAFHRYGNDYFLAGIWDGYWSTGRSIPMFSMEREKAKSASLGTPEVVIVLARL
jgi:hypothetical protein